MPLIERNHSYPLADLIKEHVQQSFIDESGNVSAHDADTWLRDTFDLEKVKRDLRKILPSLGEKRARLWMIDNFGWIPSFYNDPITVAFLLKLNLSEMILEDVSEDLLDALADPGNKNSIEEIRFELRELLAELPTT